MEADEDRDEIDPARHDHHAERRAEHEEVVLAGRRALDFEVAHGHEDRHRRGDEEDHFEEQRELIDRDQAVGDLDVGVRERHERGERRADDEQRDPRQRVAAPAR
ncbi:MAG: hypothetical protein LAO77_16540 [Acidobacteriia bacterium]|nr:hypothetical protein [Terriglobia bacterium]